MRVVLDLIAFGHPELLASKVMKCHDLDKQVETLFIKELGELKVDNFKESYTKTIDNYRKKELFFSYLASLKKEGAQATAYFKDIVEFILNGTFYEKRYDIPHLR